MKAINKAWGGLMKGVQALLMVQLTGICLVLLAQVCMRYLANMPLIWSEEVAMFLMCWITFAGVGYGVHHRLHIRMTSLEKCLSVPWRKALVITVDVICLAACAMTFPDALEYFTDMAAVEAPGSQLPYGLVYICLPFGFGVAVLAFVMDIIRVASGDLPD